MKCPYAINRHNVSQTDFQYDDDGVQTFNRRLSTTPQNLWIVWKRTAAHGVTAGASTIKLIRAATERIGSCFFHTIFAVAGVKTPAAGDATPVTKA